MLRGRNYLLKIGTKTVTATIAPLKYKVNVNTLEHLAADRLELNDIGRVHLRLSEPIVADVYRHHAEGGRLILIDAATNTTAGAAMISAIAAWSPEI